MGAAAALTGIDISPAMLKIAADRARQFGREADLREADARRRGALPVPPPGPGPRQGFAIERQERFKLGIVDRIAGRKPAPP